MKKVVLYASITLFSLVGKPNINNLDNEIPFNKNHMYACFVENKGQWASDVLFLCKLQNLDVWITKYGINYTFYKINHHDNSNNKSLLLNLEGNNNDVIIGHRVLWELLNVNQNIQVETKNQLDGYLNYLIGNNNKTHTSNVRRYKEIIIKNIYNGIDIRYYFDKNENMRFDFIVQPNADVSQIKFKFKGNFSDYLKDNEIIVTTMFGKFITSDLLSYQDNKIINTKFHKNENFWEILINDKYDITKPLIIDPLIWSTYIGGSSSEIARGISVDGSGNVYITGQSASINYDITPGVFQISYGGGTYDVFVSKINPSGNVLIYSTFIGGSNEDIGYGIVHDPSGNVFVCGHTYSSDFDITSGSYQTTHSNPGSWEGFALKLNATGTSLLYSTYLGGSLTDIINDICIDV